MSGLKPGVSCAVGSDMSDIWKIVVAAAVVAGCLLLAWGISREFPITPGNLSGSDPQADETTVVHFADPALENAIRELISQPDGPLDAYRLSRILGLQASGRGIRNLQGLQYCRGIDHLDLSDNELVSIEAIGNMPQLRTLYLSTNQIEDVHPLADLKWLSDLDLSGNRISDVSPLADLHRLTHLNLSDNEIVDVSTLRRINALMTLDLSGNLIEDLTGLPRMRTAHGGMPMWIPSRREYVAPSCDHPTVNLSENRIRDISALLWPLSEEHAGHALDLSGNLLDLAEGSPALGIIEELRSRGLLVCLEPH